MATPARLSDGLRQLTRKVVDNLAEIISPLGSTASLSDGLRQLLYKVVNNTYELANTTNVSNYVASVATTAPLSGGAAASEGAEITLTTSVATDRLLGRDSSGTGVAEEITVGGGLEFTGSSGIQRSALTGAVTATAGSSTTTIAAGAVGPTELASTSVVAGSYTLASITVDADGRLTDASSGTAAALPRSYLAGLSISNNATDATNDIDIAVGTCRDSTNAADITLSSILVKRLDANWAVGTNQGGLDTGSIANTTYHVFVIKRSDTSVVDVLFSTSAASPTMPANYDFKRRIGSILRAAGTIVAFSQMDDEFLLITPVVDVNTTTLGVTATLYPLWVPIGIKVRAKISTFGYKPAAGITVLVSSPDSADADPSVYFNIATTGGLSVFLPSGELRIRTNTSGQIRARSSTASSSFMVMTFGWYDTRGKDD